MTEMLRQRFWRSRGRDRWIESRSARHRWSFRAGLVSRLAGRFRHDVRGDTGTLAMLMLPSILLVFMIGVKVWEVISIRSSLNTGVALATRYLSLYPPRDVNETLWAEIAERFVFAELKNNAFVDAVHVNNRAVPVTVTLTDGGNQCTDNFVVTAAYPLNVELRLGRWAMPGMQWASLIESQIGEVVCD